MSPGSLRLGAAVLFAFIALSLVVGLYVPTAADQKTIADLLKTVLWASALLAAGASETALALVAVGGKTAMGLAKPRASKKSVPKKRPTKKPRDG